MFGLGEENSLQWFVIYTHPKQEQRADSNLRAWNVETFFPQQDKYGYGASGRKKTPVLKPLFPRYIFARFKATDLLHKVRFTRGVCDVVSFGGRPTAVADEMIAMIQSRTGEYGAVRMDDDLETGTTVIVNEGPFKNFAGVFVRKLKGTNRVMLLLQAVSCQAKIIIEREYISKPD